MRDLVGEKVFYKTFGEGTVLSIENGRINIVLTKSGEVKTFIYPDAFKTFLSLEDNHMNNAVQEQINQKEQSLRKKEEAEKRAENELRSASIRLNTPTHRPLERPAEKTLQSVKRTPSRKDAFYNAAFKCTYCDGGSSETCIGFKGLCSDSNITNNIKTGRDWCNTGELCMRRYTGEYTRSQYIEASKQLITCYECKMLLDWKACAGTINHGDRAGTRLRIDKAAPDKLAVLTTRLPDSREEDRIIFAVFIIRTAYDGDPIEEGFVLSDPDYRIELKPDEAKKMLFWNYHVNNGNPKSIKWGTGLYRYMEDVEALQILRDIVKVKEGKEDYTHASDVMNAYIKRNKLKYIDIPENSGPLAKRKGYKL